VLSGAFAPGPLGHGGVLSVVVFALVWVPRTHVPPVSLLVSLGFDELAPSPCRALGREISQWWWCHPFRKWFHCRHLPSGLGMNRAIGWVSPALAGALCQLRGGDDMDFCQLAYNLSTPSVEGGGSAFRSMAIAVSVCPPLAIGGGSHSLCLILGGGEVQHQDPLCLEHGFMPRRLCAAVPRWSFTCR
jgi:hypothetical protein